MRYDGQFSPDRTNDTHSHEFDLITGYNSHDDSLRITYKLDSIIMEHGHLLGSFERGVLVIKAEIHAREESTIVFHYEISAKCPSIVCCRMFSYDTTG